jgi:hypothetical protein
MPFRRCCASLFMSRGEMLGTTDFGQDMPILSKPIKNVRANSLFGQIRTAELRNSAPIVQSVDFQKVQLTR